MEGEGSWALTCSVYIHLNPVRLRSLGQGKEDRAREKAGLLPEGPTAGQVKARLAALRRHPWSSYHAYAGYAAKPDWLTCDRLWWHAGQEKGADPKADYRRHVEEYLRQGVEEGVCGRLTSALAIGGAAFVERLRRKVPKRARGETNARAWRRLLPFAEVIGAVEAVRGERWDDFMGRHGDYGRDLALHIGRLKCGLTLRELGKEAGNMSVPSVAKACERMLKRLETDRTMQRVAAKVIKKLSKLEA